MPLFQTQLIIGAALAEGGAFFGTIAYMIEHQYLALGRGRRPPGRADLPFPDRRPGQRLAR